MKPQPGRPIASHAAAARAVGITPATLRTWITRGYLPAGPWSAEQLQAAAAITARTGEWRRGSHAPHGSASRWTAGCRCPICTDAHTAARNAEREAVRAAFWADREAPLIAAVESGAPYRDACERIGVTTQAVARHRHRNPGFAERLDQALLAGRRRELEHGTNTAWRAGCRCPECRDQHEAHRAPRSRGNHT